MGVELALADKLSQTKTASMRPTIQSQLVGIACNLANDPKIFISWMGTDTAGAYMLSQTKRISRFTEYSVGNVYQDALAIFK